MPQIMHQFATKNLAKAEFMMGLDFAIAKSTNIDQHLHVQGMLAELIEYTEFSRACLRASEADAAPSPAGVMTPAAMPLWTVRMMSPKMFVRMCEIIQLLGAGGLVAVPSYAELAAFDAAVSSFSGRQQLYERYYSGDPVRLAGTLYGLYDKDSYIDRVVAMLEALKAHQRDGRSRPDPPAVAEEG
jgi:4-hydroxyphenylacetate 3-monooxygenase